MAAMKPRTGDGPMEAEREPRGLIILRVPLEGGGRLVVSVNDEEAKNFIKFFSFRFVDRNDQTTSAFEWNSKNDQPAWLFFGFHRTVAGAWLHCCHV